MHRRLVANLLCIAILVSSLGGICLAKGTVTQSQVEQQLEALVAEYERTYYTGDFNGATQCKGFADMIYDKLFHLGYNVGAYPEGVFYYMDRIYDPDTAELGRIAPGYGAGAEAVAKVQALLSQALPGDYIQMKRSYRYYAHSMIVLDTDADGAWVFHANWEGGNKVSVDYFTWVKLTTMSDGISLYHYTDYEPVDEGDETPPPAPNTHFTDVPETAWYYPYVEDVAQHGLMNGMTETTFVPGGKMNRAMVATVLYRLSGDTSSYSCSFADVAADRWYYQGIGWAQMYGIATGYPDGTFRPNQDVTREQLAVFLYRFTEYEGRPTDANGDLSQFSDAASLSAYAVQAVKWAVGNGIIGGFADGTLRPKDTATRAQVAKVLSIYWQLFRTEKAVQEELGVPLELEEPAELDTAPAPELPDQTPEADAPVQVPETAVPEESAADLTAMPMES